MLQLILALVAGVSIGGIVLWLTGTGQRARLQ
jgi:hypothetical protein